MTRVPKDLAGLAALLATAGILHMVGRGTGSRGRQVAILARLPLQIPMIRTALKATGRI